MIDSSSATAVGAPTAKSFPNPTAQGGDAQLIEDSRLLANAKSYLRCLAHQHEPDSQLRSAWAQFFRVSHPLIRQVVDAYKVPLADRDDCVQEVWIKIITVLPSICYNPARGQLRCLLFTLIRNRVIDFVRDESRTPLGNEAGFESTLRCREPDPSVIYERRRRCRLVREALTRLKGDLSTKNYRLLRLRWLDEESVTEVSAKLDLAPGAVCNRLQRLKRKLRQRLRMCAEEAQATSRPVTAASGRE